MPAEVNRCCKVKVLECDLLGQKVFLIKRVTKLLSPYNDFVLENVLQLSVNYYVRVIIIEL